MMTNSDYKHNDLTSRFIRWFMRLAHKYNWHYAPPIYPDGDTQLWCKWCGFRQTIKLRTRTVGELEAILNSTDPVEVTINPDGSLETNPRV